VILHVKHAKIHQTNLALVVLQMVHILITMKNFKPVQCNVLMVIIKATIIVYHVIKHA